MTLLAERYYTSMARHMLRYYCKNLDGPGKDVDSWYTVHCVLKGLSDSDREIVINLHKDGEPVFKAIQRLSRDRRMDARRLWDLVKETEYSVAKAFRWT